MPVNKIVIAVSSCLLGHKVRYDGNDKRNLMVENQLCNYFDCRPVCPEYAAGLGVPRAPIHVVKIGSDVRAVGTANNAFDVTDLLEQYADYLGKAIPQLCGYVFKARSPSCGLVDVPIYNNLGNQINVGSGIFASQIHRNMKTLPVIDEIQLAQPQGLRDFIQEVERYSRSLACH